MLQPECLTRLGYRTTVAARWRSTFGNERHCVMFKFSISSAKQLAPAHLDGFFKSRKFIALDLYNSLDQHSAAERDKIQERILCRFSNQNGTIRYTHNHRFDEFDTLAVSNIVSTYGA